ncbi:hypothetical protein BKA61DRAFT_179009 [Leptodontidium sp. MPI-SDFR-AT-0119]|nr:hypothetical protein BKA61DRAFT_179009 [Leptodontidium sp. MPI-SDFR-AT-0119]
MLFMLASIFLVSACISCIRLIDFSVSDLAASTSACLALRADWCFVSICLIVFWEIAFDVSRRWPRWMNSEMSRSRALVSSSGSPDSKLLIFSMRSPFAVWI